MKKVIAINSSRRKQNTYGLICQVQSILKNHDIEVEIINLFDYNIGECIGCEHCILEDSCVLVDDEKKLMDKLEGSDGIILTSPVYMENVSGKLKTFVDRTCKWFHRPVICGKPVLVMATTKGSGLKTTLNYLERVAIQWGGINAGRIGRSIGTMRDLVRDQECESFIRHLESDKRAYKPSLKSLINFQVQKVLADVMSGRDGAYWKAKGWNTSSYYFSCKINIVKKVIATFIYKVLSKAMKKGENK